MLKIFEIIYLNNLNTTTMDIEDLAFDQKVSSDKNFTDVFIKFYNSVVNEIGLENQDTWKPEVQNSIIRKQICKPLKKLYNKQQLIQMYRSIVSNKLLDKNSTFESWLRAKSGRSNSGIVNLTFVMKPDSFSCKFDCFYCPNDPNVTRSYRDTEPAVARAKQNKWDPVLQFNSRVNTLHNMGHEISKLEVIIEGGTFTSYDRNYTKNFVGGIYASANNPNQEPQDIFDLQEEIKLNETSERPIIGLTVETRPDCIFESELKYYRDLGVTRVQLGIQSIFDNILDKVNRKCPTKNAIRGIYLLRQNGFKVDLHFMPDLPGTTPEVDMLMFKWLFGESINLKEISQEALNIIGEQGIQILSQKNDIIIPDQSKIYPTMVLPFTEIKKWYDEKEYIPYADTNPEALEQLMSYIVTHVPKYVRLNRLVRDFVAEDILGGCNKLGMRDTISKKLSKSGLRETDIRGREVKNGFFDIPNSKVFIQKYRASHGTEYFISLENESQTTLYGFVRLRINDTQKDIFFEALKNSAYIRELHVYSTVVPINNKASEKSTQHKGVGKFLMFIAESIAHQHGFRKTAVISGVGVRGYYRKLGYQLEDTYMTKLLNEDLSNIVCPDQWKSKIPSLIKPKNYIYNIFTLSFVFLVLSLIFYKLF